VRRASGRPVLIVAGVVLLAGIAAAWVAGELLTRPAAQTIGPAPVDLGATTVRIQIDSGGELVGWWARPATSHSAVLLLHGVRSNRTQMLERARVLRRNGHAVLLIDLPAHGESSGERITFGVREADGVRAALGFLRRELPGHKVGVIAVSLGAAALVLADAKPAPDAVVLESMYPAIDDAVRDRLRMRLGPVGESLAPVLLWQLPLRLGISPQQLRPIDAIGRLGSPVLVASGTADQHTPWAETERLFAAAREPKALWPVDGAAHVDLQAHAPRAYAERVLGFLSLHLGKDVQ